MSDQTTLAERLDAVVQSIENRIGRHPEADTVAEAAAFVRAHQAPKEDEKPAKKASKA